MIYTDYIFIISDNPSDNYKELHDFVKSLKMDKGYHYNSEGRIYYRCRNKAQIMGLMQNKVYRITRKQMMKYISRGKLTKTKKRINYLHYRENDFFLGIILELMEYNQITYNKITPKIVKAVKNRILGYCWFDLYHKFYVDFSRYYPNGRCYVVREYEKGKKEEIEMEIPEYIVNKMNYNAVMQAHPLVK